MRFVRGFVFFTAVVCVTVAASASAAFAADYTANVTPSAVAPKSSTTFTVTLFDESAKNPLNAATVTPPQGFTLTAAALQSPSGNATVQMQNGQVVVKGLSLKQNQSASVSATATAPASCAQSSWAVEAFKSSLNGPKLTLDTQNSSLTTTVTSSSCPAAALKFVNEPASAFVGQTISATAFNPFGPPVTVDLVDGLGNVVHSSAPVTISQGSGPAGATLGGTTTQNAVNGVATFNNLTLNKAGDGYTLVANSAGLPSATSTPFGENSQTTNCPGGACTASLSSPPGTTASSITVTTTGQAGANGNLNLSVDTGTKPVCGTLAGTPYVGHDQNFYSAIYTPDAGTPQVAKTIKYTIFNTGGAEGIHLCFAAPYQFEQLDDSPAVAGTLPDGSSGFVGLLETCDSAEDGTTPDPCQTVATVPDTGVSSGSDTVFTITVPAGEPGDPAIWG
jgi:hypothetical protein